jgi:hypothetical protein
MRPLQLRRTAQHLSLGELRMLFADLALPASHEHRSGGRGSLNGVVPGPLYGGADAPVDGPLRWCETHRPTLERGGPAD